MANSIKFGDLLVRLQLISEANLMDSLKVAPQFGLPLGRTMVLSGLLSEAELQLAIELQSLINMKGFSMEAARDAANRVRVDGVSPTEALVATGLQAASITTASTLGNILLKSGVINQQQLDAAQKISYETGIRLGRALVLSAAIDHALLTKALEVQTMVRDKKISIAQAIELISNSVPKPKGKTSQSISLESHSMRPAPAKKQVRFGEFLVLCGLATESEILNAMETSLNQQKSLGEAIVELGLVSKKVFDKTLELHQQVCAGEITVGEAADRIHKMVFKSGESNSGNTAPVALGELLKFSGLVDDSDISEAISLSNKYPSLIGKMLVVSGAIDEATLIASLRAQYLLKYGYISLEDAIRCLQYTKDNRISFDDSLEELGVRKPGV